MLIEILYTHACPHHPRTMALVQALVEQLGIAAEVRQIEVHTADDAERLRFPGSPTVRVDGRDVEASPNAPLTYALSCRLYGTSGTPPADLILAALREGSRG